MADCLEPGVGSWEHGIEDKEHSRLSKMQTMTRSHSFVDGQIELKSPASASPEKTGQATALTPAHRAQVWTGRQRGKVHACTCRQQVSMPRSQLE